MKWFGLDDEGQMRVCGLPFSGLWCGDSDALMEGFEPENPTLVVPRKYGLGWSLNLGAIAVKAGWIRPDDSLPDLADHVPDRLRKTLAVAPLLGGTLTVGMSVAVARKKTVAARWSLLGKPLKFASGSKAAVAPLVLSGAVALLPQLARKSTPESQVAIDLTRRADILGVQAMALAGAIASYRSASHPEKRQALAAVAPLLWPVVSCGVQVVCVKTALLRINADLRAHHEK